MIHRIVGRSAVLSVLFIAVSASAAATAAAPATKAPNFCGAAGITCPDPFFAGAITATGAGVWARTSEAAAVSVRYAKSVKPNVWTTVGPIQTAAASDFTAHFQLSGLIGNTNYTYQIGVLQKDQTLVWSPNAWFTTVRSTVSSVSFSVFADFQIGLAESPAVRTATATPSDFVLFIGDMDHRNPAQVVDGGILPPGDPRAITSMRRMHQYMRNPGSAIGADIYNGLIASTATKPQTPFYYAWDDHDYCANNVGANCPNRDFAFQAYRENYLWSADTGLSGPTGCEADNQRISYGTLVDVFMLDARSNRVDTGDAITMLGSCQLNWLLQGLRTSTATWKFIMSPVPFNNTTKTYDAWGFFPAERASILDAIKTSQIRNVVIMSGDIHSGGAYDDGTHSGMPEISVPHANMPTTWVNTYCRAELGDHQQIIGLSDEPGTWTIGTMTAPNTTPVPTCLDKDYTGKAVVVSTPGPYPLDGVNAPGYARVELSAKFATIKVIGADGVLRTGVLADGSAAPLSLKIPVAKKP